jgi:Uma2 family endonuclease
MTQAKIRVLHNPLPIKWEKLPDDFILPDDPVESNLQPLLAAALRESLELANLILESMLIASNFGICATVGDKTVVKAPDWLYIANVKQISQGKINIRRSYTPNLEGEIPKIVMEFISETEGGEYSINPHYPFGKWHFYEQILQIPLYIIFHPQTAELDVYHLKSGQYELQKPNENNLYWLEEIGLFLGVWQGQKAEVYANWLRWWNQDQKLLLWGTELLAKEREILKQEKQRTQEEKQRADQAELLLQQEKIAKEKLLNKLQEIGVNLNDLS